ncbi:YkgJ family cysteine cluster protein [Sulfurimonas sp. HSL-1716]|uniref:YkgJ family cysteine cluster protein n=1 Tax=Hydrocurvibacter sulfurireducens TaxID=3131937 RepID=UPI0031F7B15F
MSDLIRKEGFSYAFDPSQCETCEGRCCTGESGYIYLTQDEIVNIAALLRLDTQSFIEKYLYKKGYRYSIKEVVYEGSNDCIFFDRKMNGCSIYEARPTQCRTFPFWDYFRQRVDEVKQECPGISDD